MGERLGFHASGWQRRSFLSSTLRVLVTLVPVAGSLVLAIAGHALLPVASNPIVGILRALAILVVSLLALAVVDRLARRFLPLAALLQLSLAFPDQTPSRFRLAMRAGSSRRLAAAVRHAREEGLDGEPGRAAEQLVVLASAIGDHDRRTRGHSERVRIFAELLGQALGLDDDERAKLQWAALIHDLGKITVPPEILNKKGKPDEREWKILEGHPAAGEQLAAPAEPWLGEWVHAVGGHHERWDGSGYPRGLAGAEIPRAAAIVAVADSFEVMTAVRSYKKSMSLADARREMTRCAGSHFSPEVVRSFLDLSIGDLRRSMGFVAAIAHVPFLGRLSTATSHAPDTVATAASMTSSAATAGAGAIAISTAVVVAGPSVSMVGQDAAHVVNLTVQSETADEPADAPVVTELVTVAAAATAPTTTMVDAPAADTSSIKVRSAPPAARTTTSIMAPPPPARAPSPAPLVVGPVPAPPAIHATPATAAVASNADDTDDNEAEGERAPGVDDRDRSNGNGTTTTPGHGTGGNANPGTGDATPGNGSPGNGANTTPGTGNPDRGTGNGNSAITTPGTGNPNRGTGSGNSDGGHAGAGAGDRAR